MLCMQNMRNPKFFWISAATPLASVILSTILVVLFKSKLHGVQTVRELVFLIQTFYVYMVFWIDFFPTDWAFAKGFESTFIKHVIFSRSLFRHCYQNWHCNWNLISNCKLSLSLLSRSDIILILNWDEIQEGIAVGRTFAALKNYQVDGNKEMMAIGVMNMVGSSSSCYVTTGSFSRSAVNYNAGAQSVVSNIIMATAVLVTLLFLMPLFYYTPNFILAAIIITAVIGLIDYQAAYQLWKVDKLDFVACISSFFGVLFVSVPLGLAIAVSIFF